MIVYHVNKKVLEDDGKILKQPQVDPNPIEVTPIGTIMEPGIMFCPNCEEKHTHSLRFCQQEHGQDIVLVCDSCHEIASVEYKHRNRSRAKQMELVKELAPTLGVKPGALFKRLKNVF